MFGVTKDKRRFGTAFFFDAFFFDAFFFAATISRTSSKRPNNNSRDSHQLWKTDLLSIELAAQMAHTETMTA